MLQKIACLVAAVAFHAGAGAVCFVVAWKESPRPSATTPTVDVRLRLGSAPAVRRVDSESLETEPSDRKEMSRSDSVASHSAAREDSPEVARRPPSEPPQERAEAGAAEKQSETAKAQTPEPPYPPLARRRGWTGRGVIEFTIAADGTCRDIRVVESTGYRVLDDAMVEAVEEWRFPPGRAGNRVRRPFRFQLGDR